jgi:ubiquinol-cytochrome c reductase iron-sulfur subunit
MNQGDHRGASEEGRRLPSIVASFSLLFGGLASIGALIAYWAEADMQVFGGLVALALLGGGIGLVAWARSAMTDEVAVGERETLESSDEERAAFVEAFVIGEESIARRRLLGASLVVLVGGLAGVAVSMARSLGPNPLPELRRTAWSPGVRLVTSDGKPIKDTDLRIGSVLTVFPEGSAGRADSQTLLIAVRADLLKLSPERQSWVVGGLIAYSKICTHAGCPVGLYQEEQHLLLCPCHQSTFDVLNQAKPTSGPAARPLPQLPIAKDQNGFLIAQSDYRTPVGPGFWNL